MLTAASKYSRQAWADTKCWSQNLPGTLSGWQVDAQRAINLLKGESIHIICLKTEAAAVVAYLIP